MFYSYFYLLNRFSVALVNYFVIPIPIDKILTLLTRRPLYQMAAFFGIDIFRYIYLNKKGLYFEEFTLSLLFS